MFLGIISNQTVVQGDGADALPKRIVCPCGRPYLLLGNGPRVFHTSIEEPFDSPCRVHRQARDENIEVES